MEDTNLKRIVFHDDKDPNDIIAEILGNNNLEEDSNDYLDKMDKEIEPYFDILYNLSNKLALGSITESDFILLIEKQLHIPEKTAKNILKEIKEKFTPITKTFTDTEDESTEESSDYSESQTQNIPTPKNSETIRGRGDIPSVGEVNTIIKPAQEANLSQKVSASETPKPKKQDSYREPI